MTAIITQPHFGERLRNARLKVGMSQRALAGEWITPSYISLLERGERVPTLDVAVRLARTLETPLSELIGSGSRMLLADAGDGADVTRVLERIEVESYTETGDLSAAREALEPHIAAASADERYDELVEAGLALQRVYAALGLHDRRLELLDQLLATPVAARSTGVRVSLETDRVSTLRELGRLDDARQAADGTLRLTEAAADVVTERDHIRLLGVLASVLCEAGDFDDVDPVVDEMLDRAKQLGQPGMLGRAHWVAAMAYSRIGRAGDARAELTRANETLSYVTMPILDWLRFCRSTASVLLEIGDDLDEVLRWVEAAEITASVTGLRSEQAAARRERARFELAAGNAAEAAEIFASLDEEDLPGLDRITVGLGRARALEALGQHDAAIDILHRVADLCEESGNFRQAANAWRRIDELRHRTAPARGRERRAGRRRAG